MAKKRCNATTNAGRRCRRRPKLGRDRCAVHNDEQLDGLTAEVENTILDAVRDGAFVEEAALVAGISKRTLLRWQQAGRAEDADERFRRFADGVDRARAQANIADVVVIRRAAADGEWRAALARLERVDPRWRRKTAHEHSGPEGEPITLRLDEWDYRNFTDAELEEIERLDRKGRGK